MITNWLVRFNGTDKTIIISAPTCSDAIMQAEESSDGHAVRSVQFHSAGTCVTTEAQYHADVVGIAQAG